MVTAAISASSTHSGDDRVISQRRSSLVGFDGQTSSEGPMTDHRPASSWLPRPRRTRWGPLSWRRSYTRQFKRYGVLVRSKYSYVRSRLGEGDVAQAATMRPGGLQHASRVLLDSLGLFRLVLCPLFRIAGWFAIDHTQCFIGWAEGYEVHGFVLFVARRGGTHTPLSGGPHSWLSPFWPAAPPRTPLS